MNFLHYSFIVLSPSTAPDTLQFLYISFFLWHLVHHDFTMVHFHIRSFRSSLPQTVLIVLLKKEDY